ncbi:MAG: hypothetical protein RJS98_14385 [Rhodospirillaceae bacterium]
MFDRVPYTELNSRQKENYNFQKIAARLADYGFNSIRLTDDWQGADFIAVHIDGETFLKIQLKGRLVIDRKYLGKDIHIAFLDGEDLYIYNHDDFVHYLEVNELIGADSVTWHEKGFRHWPRPPSWAVTYLTEFRI